MASLPARVWRKFTSAIPDTPDATKVGSAKWNDDLNVFLGTVCDALSKLNVGPDQLPYFSAGDTAALTTFTAFGRLLVAANDNAAVRAMLSALNKAGDTMTGDLNMGGAQKVVGLATPTNATDAANKAYVDALATVVSGALVFKGSWDASAGTFPGAGAAKVGWFYKVGVAGTVNGVAFSVGDDVFAVADNASTTTYANNWLQIQGTITLAEVQAAVGFTFGSLAAQSSLTASQVSDASANGRSLITAANYAAMKTLLGLATVATSGAYADLSGKPTLGTAAALNVGVGNNQVVQLDGSAKLPAVDGSALTNLPSLGAIKKLATLTASNSASLSDTASLLLGYTAYMVKFTNVRPATPDTQLLCRVSTNGGSSYLTTGYLAISVWNNSSGGTPTSTATTIGIPISPTVNVDGAAGYGLSGVMYLIDPANTASRKAMFGQSGWRDSSARAVVASFSGLQDGGNSAINALQFLMSSGNIADGKIEIYGIL